MRIEQIAHILRASKAITEEQEFIMVGSQAALGQFKDVPANMAISMEIDLWPKNNPKLSEVIEGALGANSSFHEQFGYFADGVGPETAILPKSWESRSVRLEGHPLLEGAIGICPDINDLCASKLAAFREKDLIWVEAAITAKLAEASKILTSLRDIDDPRFMKQKVAEAWLKKFGSEPNDFTP